MTKRYLGVVNQEIFNIFEYFKPINESRLQMETVVKDAEKREENMNRVIEALRALGAIRKNGYQQQSRAGASDARN